jgi:hypothetical protein
MSIRGKSALGLISIIAAFGLISLDSAEARGCRRGAPAGWCEPQAVPLYGNYPWYGATYYMATVPPYPYPYVYIPRGYYGYWPRYDWPYWGWGRRWGWPRGAYYAAPGPAYAPADCGGGCGGGYYGRPYLK